MLLKEALAAEEEELSELDLDDEAVLRELEGVEGEGEGEGGPGPASAEQQLDSESPSNSNRSSQRKRVRKESLEASA
jgi:hypothetical protein